MATSAGRNAACVLVVGLGTDHRGDDGAGLEVVRALRERVGPGVELLEGPADATALLDRWSDRDRVIVVDAVVSGRPPGTLHRFDDLRTDLPAAFDATSTHGLGLAHAVALGRSLGRYPRRLSVWGIEAGNVRMGDGLTEAVGHAVREVTDRLTDELGGAAGASAGR